MKRILLSVLVASALVASAGIAMAQAQKAPAATRTTQGTPSQLVLANSSRIVETLETRRDEFSSNRAALDKFVSSEEP